MFCLHPSIGLLANALDALVTSKAQEQNISQSAVEIDYEDRVALSGFLRNRPYTDATTGNLSFTENGERKVNFFVIQNFVPRNNSNFTVNTSREFDPWTVEVRGCIMHSVLEDDFNFLFLDANETESVNNTIVFADGTTNIPPDRPVRFFMRCKLYQYYTVGGWGGGGGPRGFFKNS